MKKLFSILLLSIACQLAYTQNNDNEYSDYEYSDNKKETEFKGLKEEKKTLNLCNVRFGGDLGLGFAQNTFFAELSPTIGFQVIKDRLEIGPGLVYQHQSEAKLYTMNNIGGQAYIRGYIFDGIFAQVDGFLVNYNIKYLTAAASKSSFTYGNGFVGVGYAFNHQEAPFYLVISVKTNMLTDKYYPQRLIIPKIGFQFKFCK